MALCSQVWGKTGSKLYGPSSGADYVDNHKRFALFNKAAIEAVKALPFGPGENCVFVANDWHSALVPVLLKEQYQPRGQFKNTKVAFCIHNVAFQVRIRHETTGPRVRVASCVFASSALGKCGVPLRCDFTTCQCRGTCA